MKLYQSLGLAATTFAPLISALATFSAPSNGPSYSVGIPPNSAISATSKGGIYFSLSAPTTYAWVGLGIGEQMSGATIFVMYADGNGNVTISGRAGRGHVQPQLDSTLQTGLTLLEGSGIVNGKMVANVHCTTCQLQSSATSSSSPWIAAWNQGSALNTNSLSASINQHTAYTTLTFDLTQAALTADSNPFVAAASSTGTGSGSGTTTSGDDKGGSGSDDNTSSSGSNSGSSSGASVAISGAQKEEQDRQRAHGILMGVAVVILFPLGTIFMRLVGQPWIHAGIQVVSLVLMIAGMAIGIILADDTEMDFTEAHFVIGFIAVALLVLQPFFGLAHHYLYKRHQSRTSVSHLHIWYGRALMILAVINGGIGLRLADNTDGGKIAYGVVAGVMGAAYIAAVGFKRKGSNTAPIIKQEPTGLRDSES